MRGFCSRININVTLPGEKEPLFFRFVNTNIRLFLIVAKFFVQFFNTILLKNSTLHI